MFSEWFQLWEFTGPATAPKGNFLGWFYANDKSLAQLMDWIRQGCSPFPPASMLVVYDAFNVVRTQATCEKPNGPVPGFF